MQTRGIQLHLPRLHDAQQQVIDEAKRFNVVVCGRRWGKSLCGLDRAVWGLLDGGPVGWFAPTYKILSPSWRELQRTLLPLTRKTSVQEHRLELVNGASLDCWSLDDPNAGRGRFYRRVIIDEAAYVMDLHDVFEATIRPTLTDLQGDAWLFSTPRGYNDLQTFFERGQDPDHPDWASWSMPTITNPHIPASEIEHARATMDARFFAQEYLASFEQMAGRVYIGFDRLQNVRDTVADNGGELLIGMDFNVNPMSACIGIRAGDELHIFDEIELVDSNTQEIAAAIQARYPKRTVAVYPDPSGNARKTSAPVGMTDFSVLRDAGFGVRAPAVAPPVVDRVNEVNALCCNTEGRRRLLVHPRCRTLIHSLAQLSYKDGASVIDKQSGLDHMTDALGYLVHVEFPLLRPPIIERRPGPW